MARKKSRRLTPLPPQQIQRTVNGLRRLIRQISNQWEICRFNMELVIPLMRDPDIVAGLNQTHAANAAKMLVQTLMFDVVKDCYKFGLDRSNRRYTVASIPSAMDLLKDRGLLKKLREDYCRVDPNLSRGVAGFAGSTAKARLIAEERTKLETEFDAHRATLRSNFRDLHRAPVAKRIAKARNKGIAHSEMRTQGGAIKPFDFASIKLKYGDPEQFLELAERVVANLELLTRAADIDMPGARRLFKDYSERFWELTKLGLQHADRRGL
jgi:hypothetical protein